MDIIDILELVFLILLVLAAIGLVIFYAKKEKSYQQTVKIQLEALQMNMMNFCGTTQNQLIEMDTLISELDNKFCNYTRQCQEEMQKKAEEVNSIFEVVDPLSELSLMEQRSAIRHIEMVATGRVLEEKSDEEKPKERR